MTRTDADELPHQTEVISKSIKNVLEFTLNRGMKIKCFESLQVNNTYDFVEEFKSRLIKTVSRRYPVSQESPSIVSTSQECNKPSTSQELSGMSASHSSQEVNQYWTSKDPCKIFTSLEFNKNYTVQESQSMLQSSQKQDLNQYRERIERSTTSDTQESHQFQPKSADTEGRIEDICEAGIRAINSNDESLEPAMDEIVEEFLRDIQLLENL